MNQTLVKYAKHAASAVGIAGLLLWHQPWTFDHPVMPTLFLILAGWFLPWFAFGVFAEYRKRRRHSVNIS